MIYLLIICAILIVTIIILIQVLKNKNKKYKELEKKNKTLSDYIEALYKYSEGISRIKKERTDINEKIKNAGSPEEIIGIIVGIIDDNNKLVQDNK